MQKKNNNEFTKITALQQFEIHEIYRAATCRKSMRLQKLSTRNEKIIRPNHLCNRKVIKKTSKLFYVPTIFCKI